jgi:hypothetical protein
MDGMPLAVLPSSGRLGSDQPAEKEKTIGRVKDALNKLMTRKVAQHIVGSESQRKAIDPHETRIGCQVNASLFALPKNVIISTCRGVERPEQGRAAGGQTEMLYGGCG